jgi:hypothetical protein
MQTKNFTGGRIRRADYDPASGQLDLHWDNKTVLEIKCKSPFATEVQSKPKLFLIGTQDGLDKLVESGPDRSARSGSFF